MELSFGESTEKQGSGIRVEKITAADWAKIFALRLRASADEPHATGGAPEDVVMDGEEALAPRLEKGEYFVAKRGGEVVGMVGFREGADKQMADISDFYVLPDMKGEGIEEQLLNAVLAEIYERFPDVRRVKLTLAASQTELVSLCESLEFKKSGTKEKGMKKGGTEIDALEMVKTIR